MRIRSLLPALLLLAACGAEPPAPDSTAEAAPSTEVVQARPQIHYYTITDT